MKLGDQGDDPASSHEADELTELRTEVQKSARAKALYQAALHGTALLAAGSTLRKDKGLSQADVADLMGTTQSAVSDLEAGRVEPQLRTLQRYAFALGRRLDVALVDGAAPALSGDLLWSYLVRTALSPLLTALATTGDEGVTLTALSKSVSLPTPILEPILSDLEATGWATMIGGAEERAYSLPEQGACTIGIALNRDKVSGALMYLNGDIIQTSSRGLVDVTRTEVIDAAVDVVASLYQYTSRRVIGVGVSIAGIVEAGPGTVLFAPDLQSDDDDWRKVPLEFELQKAIQARVDADLLVAVENDANALAAREYLRRQDEPRGADESLVVLLMSGGGIGAGVVSRGMVVYGAHSAAGEGGHTIIDPHGRPCRAGLPHGGCIETVASVSGILAQLGLSDENLEKGLAIADYRVSVADQDAIDAFAAAGNALGTYLVNILVLLDPARAVLYAHPELADADRHPAARVFQAAVETAREDAWSTRGDIVPLPELEWVSLDDTTNAVAAGFAAMRHFLTEPAHWAPRMFPLVSGKPVVVS